MSLELPTPEDLDKLETDGLSDADALQQAADLFTLATGITDTPSDPFQQRLIRDAILQMAWALQSRWEDMEAVFSPFSGEHIGSYSYAKMVENYHTAATSGSATGVPLFDAAVRWFYNHGLAALPMSSSEHVFKQGKPWASEFRSRRLLEHDPGDPWHVEPDNAWPWG